MKYLPICLLIVMLFSCTNISNKVKNAESQDSGSIETNVIEKKEDNIDPIGDGVVSINFNSETHLVFYSDELGSESKKEIEFYNDGNFYEIKEYEQVKEQVKEMIDEILMLIEAGTE